MLKHHKKLRGAYKHFRKTGDPTLITNVLSEDAIKDLEKVDKLITAV